MSAGFVPAVIDRLTRQYPKMVFHVTQGDPATLQDRELRSRNIELAVGRILEPYPAEGMNAEVLFNETVFVAVGADNKWVRRRKVDLADLIDKPWALPPTASIAYSYMTTAFSAAGLTMP
jgi:DNA-binding transcriptional LysR family regulator